MEEDDPEVFEIDDFTAASDWERFIYRIEETIGPHGWKLDNTNKRSSKTECTDRKRSESISENTRQSKWDSQYDVLSFSGFQFLLTHYKLNEVKPVAERESSTEENFSGALNDAFDMQYDFPARTHKIARWYGVQEFIILAPKNPKDFIGSESRTNLLWSSIGMALNNLKCEVPMFLQTGHFDRHLYYGMCLDGGFRTSFEMIHLKRPPHQCNHVQGMIETFHSKLAIDGVINFKIYLRSSSKAMADREKKREERIYKNFENEESFLDEACPLKSPINVSIRFLYMITCWKYDLFCDDLPSELILKPGENFFSEIQFGPMQDPVSNFQLAAVWPCASSECLVDNETYSELNPLEAPVWKLKVKFEKTPTLLNEYLQRFLELSKSHVQSTAQIIRSLSQDETHDADLGDVSHVLDRLAEPGSVLSKPLSQVVTHAARNIAKSKLNDSPLPEDVLNAALKHVFPDARCTKEESLEVQRKLDEEQKSLECDTVRSGDKYRHLKAAPVDSLTYNLAVTCCIINGIYGANGVAHLWHEFVLEMRYRYENEIIIPRLARTIPNLNYCLIHQKLQILNYCIERRQIRTTASRSHSSVTKIDSSSSNSSISSKSAVSYQEFANSQAVGYSSCKQNNRDNSWNELLANISKGTGEEVVSLQKMINDSDDDEFYEARENISEEILEETETSSITDIAIKQPEGVLKETAMKLLKTNAPLNVPITQEPPPLTEDMLVEQQDILQQLGTSDEAARIRAQMQSASLLSDMESFKAANPGCILEDFVRWYSPNDWLEGPETEAEKQELEKLLKESSKEAEAMTGWDHDEDTLSYIEEDDNDQWKNEGHLSLRMRMPNNMWREVWETARAVPAKRQKRLFDDTKEAEKVLHYLSSLNLTEISLQFFPILIQHSLIRLCKESDITNFSTNIDQIVKETSHLYTPTVNNVPTIKKILEHIHAVEYRIFLWDSIRIKFENLEIKTNPKFEKLIEDLLTKDEVEIEGSSSSDIGKILSRQLEHQQEEIILAASMRTKNKVDDIESEQRATPYPVAREYILRAIVNRPSPTSRPCPQRLYTAITFDEFRMAGMFTQDTNFI